MAIPTIRPQIKRSLVVLFWAIFAWGYFSRFPIPGFLAKSYFLTLALLTSLSAWGFGSLIVASIDIPAFSFAESAVLSTAAGFGLLSLLMIGMGVLGLWTRSVAALLVGLGLCAAWPKRNQWIEFFKSLSIAPTRSNIFPFGLMALGLILSFLSAFAPVIYYDSLVYHFALPQSYIHAGHWIGQPELIYSAFPQMMEMIWTLGMLLAGDAVANLLGWILSVIGVIAVYLFAKRFLGSRTAIWSAAFLASMPAYMLLSTGGYIDVSLAVFSFLSFYVLCLWSLSPSASCLALAGFFAGCAVGCKYTGAIPLALGVLFILKESRASAVKTIFSYQAVFIGTSMVVFCPWLLKNIHYVGNPVFPFFYRWNPLHLSPWVGDAAGGYFRGLTEYAPRSWWRVVKLLWDVAVHGMDFGGGMDVLGDLGWAPLIIFLPAIWLVRKRSPTVTMLLLYALLFYIPWAMTRPVLRFLIPLVPFLAITAAYGYDQGLSDHKIIRTFARLLLIGLFISGFRTFFDFTDAVSLLSVPLGFESRTEYLTRKLNYYAAAAFVNTLPEGSLTYVVGDQRGYYYNGPVLVTPVFNKNPLTEWANNASSGKDLAAVLTGRRITHVLINHSEMARLDKAYHLFPFTSKGQANWDSLQARAKTIYQDAHCSVISL